MTCVVAANVTWGILNLPIRVSYLSGVDKRMKSSNIVYIYEYIHEGSDHNVLCLLCLPVICALPNHGVPSSHRKWYLSTIRGLANMLGGVIHHRGNY